jgi:outer membrane protein assembly factor BamB
LTPQQESNLKKVKGEWLTEQFNTKHISHNPIAKGPSQCPTVQWAFQVGVKNTADDDFYHQPIIANGTVYALTVNQTLYALNAETGEERWQFHEPANTTFGPTFSDGMLYFAVDTGLKAFDVRSRSEHWYYSFGYESGKGLNRDDYLPADVPTLAEGFVYVGTGGGVIHAVNIASGEGAWTFSVPADRPPGYPTVEGLDYNSIAGPITVSDGRVFASSWNGRVYALDAKTGELHWEYNTNDQLEGAVTVDNDTVYATGDQNVFAIDMDGGTLRWKLNGPEEDDDVARGSPAVADGTLYVGRGTSIENLKLAAVNTADGSIQWETRARLQQQAHPSIANGVVYVPARRLLALDAETGDILWAYDHQSTIGGAPPIVDDVLFAGDWSGRLVAIS